MTVGTNVMQTIVSTLLRSVLSVPGLEETTNTPARIVWTTICRSRCINLQRPHFAEKLKDLIFENDKIKITDWAKFKFNNGYVSPDLTKVDFSKLKCPT
ncbi:hypothetical protein SARC_07573 [Sphaeroforma arctica JP610]|uniref:Uncharacterized protein n=1 Tax=Sphaeroforma arctica JP610 TaxID=667725 RepID=A0A0L0FTV0_9EUKA|nr:hypothetical protein SARC_07573 [Sphaeroforma arctica JP610]KNC80064.1 hypothetical protein SARC_07573 [Sphaeroforma arctica JP610]|eukprot:XP_014153966.1 hypothetical protein SARC_07573 [Sphaeroforma arctica JP610]